MIYKNKFNLTGDWQQNNIVIEALDAIKFPWDKLTFPGANGVMEIGWRDLNNGAVLGSATNARLHAKPVAGTIMIEGKAVKWVLGIFYTHGEGIFVDQQLVKYPEYAKSTVSAEIAHAVDAFLPLTDIQRGDIIALMHKGETHPGLDTWWEVNDYNAEYFGLSGECFMQAFTVAYSDIPFGNADDFRHYITKEESPELRRILGIQRTDYVAPAPPKKVKHKGRYYDTTLRKTIYYIMYEDNTFVDALDKSALPK